MLPGRTGRAELKADLFDLLSEKKKLWQEFYELTLAQAEMLTPDKSGELLELLDRKDKCIRALAKLNDAMNALYADGYHGIEVENIRKLQQDIFDLMRELQQADAINREKITASFLKHKREIENFQTKKEAVSGYVRAINGGKGYFVDSNR